MSETLMPTVARLEITRPCAAAALPEVIVDVHVCGLHRGLLMRRLTGVGTP